MAAHAFYNEATKDLVIDEDGVSHDGYTDLGALPTNAPNFSLWPWNEKRSEILTASIVKLSEINSTNGMFYNCSKLQTIDLSSFDTSSVIYMTSMFGDCSKLQTIDLSSFDTSSVTRMNGMFFGCTSLTSLDLSSFDTSNVTDMNGMFFGCTSLTSLDLSSLDTSNVTEMGNMFYSCLKLQIIDLSDSMSNVLFKLPDESYYPVYGGESVAKADLTAGTWVSDPSILEQASSIVHVRQGLRDRVHKLERKINGIVGIATTAVAGIVKPDGATITVDPDGTIKAIGGGGGGVTYSADETSLHLEGTQFSVKDGGITAGKIAEGVIPEIATVEEVKSYFGIQ